MRPGWTPALFFLGLVALLMLLLALGWKRDRDRSKLYHQGVVLLKNLGHSGGYDREKGFWTGDVTELFRRGLISRELAEADIAPITPLVERPRPFRGYFVVAMNCGPPEGIARPRQIKDARWDREMFAYCMFPAEGTGKDYPVFMICPWGMFRKPSENNAPILDWPMGEWRQGWAIID